ncbi:MAG: MarR family winged helix-turn-helix transcriptional regulator [Candidatus Nanopelagicales bacterium]|jgi:DNA-binding MarR family transcriptional regulator
MGQLMDISGTERVEWALTVLVRRADQVYIQSENGARPLERAAYLIMGRLFDSGPCRMGDLADASLVTSSTISRQVSGLVADGYIHKEFDDLDRRACQLSLTERGTTALLDTRARRREIVRTLLSTWADEDITKFAYLLDQLNAGLDDLVAGPERLPRKQEMVDHRGATGIAVPTPTLTETVNK